MNSARLAVVTLGCMIAATMLSRPAEGAVESLWGSREFHARNGNLRYLLLLPPHYDAKKPAELWVNLHGSPGCASHAIFQYRLEAASRNAILLAPEATEGAGEYYTLEGAGKAEYHLWDMKSDPAHVLTILDDVLKRYRVASSRIVLLGFSAGCEMGWRLIAARPCQFCFFGGVANRFKNGRMPARGSSLREAAKHVPMFYGVGADDAFAGPWFKTTLAKLKGLGFELRSVNPKGVGHDLPSSIKIPLLLFLDEVRSRPARAVPT